MQKISLKTGFLCLAILVAGWFPLNASATIIDFSLGNTPSGQMSIDANGNMVGSNISLANLSVQNAPINNGPYTLTDAVLNFAYGTGSGALNYITVDGSLPSPLSVGFGNLLTGTFSSVPYLFTSGSLDILGTGPDTKSAALLTALGLPIDTQFQFLGFSASGADTGALNTAGNHIYSVISVDVKNTSVPEPSTLILLGSGMVGLAFLGRKRFQMN